MGGAVSSPPLAHQNVTQAYRQFETDMFDEPAFEAAFAQARAQVEFQESAATKEDAETLNDSLQTDTHPSVEGAEQIKIGSDAILQPDSLTHVNDADELAKTAEQLLDSLCHEQSQKFKQSSFLALMRRIRDREVHIEGDEFREVSSLCEIVQSIRTCLCYSLLISSPDHAVTTSWWSALPRGSVKSCDRPYGCRLPLNLTSPAPDWRRSKCL